MNAFVISQNAAAVNKTNNDDATNHDVNKRANRISLVHFGIYAYFGKLNFVLKVFHLHCGNSAIKLSCRFCLWLSLNTISVQCHTNIARSYYNTMASQNIGLVVDFQ